MYNLVKHWVNPEKTACYYGRIIDTLPDGRYLMEVHGRMSHDNAIEYRELLPTFRVASSDDPLLETIEYTKPNAEANAAVARTHEIKLQEKLLLEARIASYNAEQARRKAEEAREATRTRRKTA